MASYITRSTSGVTLALAILLLCTGKLQADENIKILPLGDSITQGTFKQPSYREALWLMLQEHGINVDFVGSHQELYGSSENVTSDFDQDHEGHWGWEVNQIVDALPGWLELYTADIVLIHLGTNDFDRGEEVDKTLVELQSVLELLRANNPNITILLAEIIPMRFKSTRKFNASLRAWAKDHSTSTSELILVDQYSGYYSIIDNYDKYHPNSRGQRKIAKRWFNAIRQVIQ